MLVVEEWRDEMSGHRASFQRVLNTQWSCGGRASPVQHSLLVSSNEDNVSVQEHPVIGHIGTVTQVAGLPQCTA